MHVSSVLAHAPGVLFGLGYVLLIVDILRKKWRPQRVTWFIWTAVNFIVLWGMYQKHAVNDVIVVATICTAAVAGLSVWRGLGGWTTMDKLCVGGAVIGAAIAAIRPTAGLVASCLVILIGALPTFAHAYREPKKENFLAWGFFWMGSTWCALCLPDRSLAVSAQPITFLLLNAIVFSLLWPERD